MCQLYDFFQTIAHFFQNKPLSPSLLLLLWAYRHQSLPGGGGLEMPHKVALIILLHGGA